MPVKLQKMCEIIICECSYKLSLKNWVFILPMMVKRQSKNRTQITRPCANHKPKSKGNTFKTGELSLTHECRYIQNNVGYRKSYLSKILQWKP